MSLWVRLETSFWTHRKTLRLHALIGDAAFWIPPRLWSYAATNQPDGDFSNYLPKELAMLVAYQGDAQAMLEALQQAKWMDGMKIHDWAEHNGSHVIFHERAKTAAAARWKGKKEKNQKREKKTIDKNRIEKPSNATSITSSALSDCLAKFSENLRREFLEWISFRKGMGKKPKNWDAMFLKQAKWLLQFSESDQIEILEQSMRNGWQGLQEPKRRPQSNFAFAGEGIPKPKSKSDLLLEETLAKRRAQP